MNMTWDSGMNFGDSDKEEDKTRSFESFSSPNAFDMGTVAPVFGIQGSNSGADYLDYDIRGRSYSERMMYYTGTSYLGGIFGGGLFGIAEGIREAPSRKFKIQLNSVSNACGKRGSRAGNALGVLEALADNFDADRYVGHYDQIIPIAAAATTGALYKATAGPRPMALAAVLGAIGMATVTTAVEHLNI